MVANGINAAALFDHLVNVDKFDFATAQTIVDDALAKQAAKVAAQPIGETLALSQKIDKQLGIGKKAPKINAQNSAFAQPGIVKQGGELTKKGKKLVTTHKNAQGAIDGAKAYKAREAARLAKEKVRLAKNAEHVAKLKQNVAQTTNTTKINAQNSVFAQPGIVRQGGELTEKGKKLITTHKNAQSAIDGAKAARLAKEKVRLAKNELLKSSVLKGKVNPEFIKGLTSDQVTFLQKGLKKVESGKMSASKLVSWCQNKTKALANNNIVQNTYRDLVKNNANKKGILNKITNSGIVQTIKKSFSKAVQYTKGHPVKAAAIFVGTLVGVTVVKNILSGGSEKTKE